MATFQVSILFNLLVIASPIFLLPHACYSLSLKPYSFDSIYQLGDSIADTGNLERENGSLTKVCSKFPYGETYFKKATGRCSDGRLIIDFVAQTVGLPFLNPYLEREADFSNGVNFAVSDATALPSFFLANYNIVNPVTNSSLDVQLGWMQTYFNFTCTTRKDCAQKLKNALFIVGEIGLNDIRYALFQAGKSIEFVKTTLLPPIIQTIKHAVNEVINQGAIRVVVPGNFPIGCFPLFLTSLQTNDTTAYDELNCLKEVNNLSMYQNSLLQQAVQELNQENPNAVIVYADYYSAFLWVFRNAALLGFDLASRQKSCCGIGGSYNFDLLRFCGNPGVPVCPNPNKSISWDGIHLTQRTYGFMTQWLIRDILAKVSTQSFELI